MQLGEDDHLAHAPPGASERFRAAVALAAEIHGGRRRKGTGIPYLAHLFVVTGLVIEDGGDEAQAIAAMLHDAVEDGGGRPLLDRIDTTFGDHVAAIVEHCSDKVDPEDDRPWIERKRLYLSRLYETEDDAVLRVALADKVHNARSMVRNHREEGDVLWQRFTHKTARDQLWYYGGLLAFFERRRPGPLTEDLGRAVGELAWLVACSDARRSEEVRMWVDADLHHGLAPSGWIHVRTADEAIRLMDAFTVRALSFDGAALDAQRVVDWLSEQSEDGGRDRWPTEQITFHSEPAASAVAQLDAAIERHSRLRRSGADRWTRN